jgi:hypothetical protein
MIDFACHCGNRLSVPADLAGGLIQCPKCQRLNDVPLLSDIGHIEEDGIYKLDEPPPAPVEPDRVRTLTYAFTRDHFDADGNPIDLRPTVEQINAAGGGDAVPLELADQLRPGAPKYDPITGELIRPIDVTPSEPRIDVAALPAAKLAPAPPPRSVDGMDVPPPLEALAIPIRLFKPINLLVMGFILLAHFVAQLMAAAIAAFYIVLAPVWLLLHCAILAHFGNVIDETGPVSRHELPAPLRSVTSDDTLSPFFQFFWSLALCYGPSVAVMFMMRAPWQVRGAIAVGLAVVGTIFFPAVLLTLSTSGSVLNVRPDRLVGVMKVCSAEYVLALITWIVGAITYVAGTVGVTWIGASFLAPDKVRVPSYVTWYGAYAVLIVGIYTMHLFCWHLGTLYRRHHVRFPWVLQRYTGERRIARAVGFPIARRPAARPIARPPVAAARPTPPAQATQTPR